VPQEPDPTKRRASDRPGRPTPKRRQYRWQGWEDDCDPQLADPPAPVIVSATASDAETRSVKIDVFRARHEARQRLHHAGDAMNPEPDLAGALMRLGMEMRNAALRHRGLRSATRKPSRPTPGTKSFRVQVWDSTKQRTKHVGYVRTKEEAEALKASYYRSLGIDVQVDMPAWLLDLVKAATQLQADGNVDGEMGVDADDADDNQVRPGRGRFASPAEDAIRLALVAYGHLRPLSEAELAAHTGLARRELVTAIRGAANRRLLTAIEADGDRRYTATPF
jgi:hypothetical protein